MAARRARKRSAPPASRKLPAKDPRPKLDDEELTALVCSLFASGTATRPSDIKKHIESNYGNRFTRERAYAILAGAAKRRWMCFLPPPLYALQDALRRRYGLKEARVVRTPVAADVCSGGARMLMELLAASYAGREVHIGLSGGSAMRAFVRRFAQMVHNEQNRARLPSIIHLHSLVSGFDLEHPTDPNAFFTFFDSQMPVEVKFVNLHVQPMASQQSLDDMKHVGVVKEAFERARKLDIICTSCSVWEHEHCMLRRSMEGEASQRLIDVLNREGCAGDLLWQPLALSGPIDTPTELSAVSIKKLNELPKFVKEGRQVLLLAGPCGVCGEPKDPVVDVILRQQSPLITHLATDHRCAANVLHSSKSGFMYGENS
jgi:DNA-binding transcriptional regulator LsrR (DeoR family)